MSKTVKTPELARYATVEASALIQTYCDWIEQETGRRPDAWSVYVGSQLRGTFQKSEGNQKRIAAQAAAFEQAKADKVRRAADRAAAKAEKAAQPKETKPKTAPKAKAPVTPTAPQRRRPARTVATKEA